MKEEKLKYSFVTCFPRKEQIFNIWLMGLGKVSSKNNIFMTLTLTVGHLGNISFFTKTGRGAYLLERLGGFRSLEKVPKNYGCFVETFS